MALRCEYFVATTDREAAQTAKWAGGPSDPTSEKRGFLRRRSGLSTAAPLPSLDLPGVEPVVMMATLEEVLTGEAADDILPENVMSRVGGTNQATVFRLRRQLGDALVGASADRLRE